MRFEGEDYTLRKKDGEILIRTWPSAETMANPLWWFAWTWQFFFRWLISRPLLPLLLAIPSVATIAFAVATAAAGSGMSKSTIANDYRRAVQQGLATEDYNRAKLAASALVEMYPDSEDQQYDLALVQAQTGDEAAAAETMQELAEERGSAKAAIWLANSVGDYSDFASFTPDQQTTYLRWVSVAADNDPSDPNPRKLKGQVLRSVGDFQGAYEALAPLAEADAETGYLVTFLERQLGFEDRALQRAEPLRRHYASRLDENPQDTNARLRVASMLAIAGKETDALRLLDDGRNTVTDPSELRLIRSAMAETMILQSAQLLRDAPKPIDLMRGLQLLQDALKLDPNNPKLIEAVAQACVKAASSENNDLVVLREALVQTVEGVEPTTSHFILGTVALNEGDVEKAAYHLEIAAKSNPNLPGLLNNLAFSILQQEDADLERALRLSNAAVRQLPNHPYLRETRGAILLRLERYADAIADLEQALRAKELRPQVRDSLAQAYDALGDTEIANRQRQLKAQGK
ncbi:MAG: tetratricopeptide repeat protein [Planctomycetota bacterium]